MKGKPAVPHVPEHINIISSNIELNGRGDARVRTAAHCAWTEAGAHLVLQQELPDGAADGKAVMYDAENRLTMQHVLGSGSYTALFYDREVFTCLREWEHGRRAWSAPPAAASLRLVGTGPAAVPLLPVAAHLSYDSYTQRETEGGWLSAYADKKHMIDGVPYAMPAIIGVDRNSYRAGDPNTPRLEEIPNLPHRAHRSRPGPGGTRVMDTVPDETLHLAGLVDVLGHLAATRDVSKMTTMAASTTHGPATTVDAVYADYRLLPALVDAEIIDMRGTSDHDAVLTRWHWATLAELLSDQTLWHPDCQTPPEPAYPRPDLNLRQGTFSLLRTA
ncbi:endonuclease/exonuclease/phosphatase family protein [Streptomyces sp. NPDC050610]|uniref:endonuclease/exonuclease/phosphatase family protein n=1 Tax=Streptomyces sp. NPDC050610 TaxID=3157097 RepID=UPI00342B1B30